MSHLSNVIPRIHTDFVVLWYTNRVQGWDTNLVVKRGTFCSTCAPLVPLSYITQVLTLIYHFVWGLSASEWKEFNSSTLTGVYVCVCVRTCCSQMHSWKTISLRDKRRGFDSALVSDALELNYGMISYLYRPWKKDYTSPSVVKLNWRLYTVCIS